MDTTVVNDNVLDTLTNVYKKEYFYDKAREIIDGNPATKFAIMELDINCLTMINDMYGLLEGDRLLVYMGKVLSDVFEDVENSIVARIHADLFVCLFPYTSEKADEYINIIEDAVDVFGSEISIELLLSFGIYIVNNTETKISSMCERANLALKTVKGNYMNHVAYFDKAMRDKAILEVDITSRMAKALEDGEFVVYYQPKHSLDDERIIGAEALVRWISPEKGMISPGVFIPIFEDNGFIMKLDVFVWEETCKFIRSRIEAGLPVPPISVNVSRVDLFNPDIVDVIISMLDKYQIGPGMLKLEFTESAYTESEQLMLNVMEQLHGEGLEIDMDDFGSGYSSLNMLKDVPVDGLKIDLRFLSKSKNEIKGRRILASVIQMAKRLGIPAIVEGVETKEQIELLRSYGCTSVQGYYYARPMPEEHFIEYIDNRVVDTSSGYGSVVESKVMDPEVWWDSIVSDCEPILEMHSAYMMCEKSNIDHEIDILKVSDSFYELFATSRSAMFTMDVNLSSYVYPEDLDHFIDAFRAAKDYHSMGQCIYRNKSGEGLKWIHAKVRLIAKNDGSEMYFCILDEVSRCMKEYV